MIFFTRQKSLLAGSLLLSLLAMAPRVLAQTGTLTGHVFNADGVPVNNVVVQVVESGDQVIASNRTQSDGSYTIAGIPIQTCQIINVSCRVEAIVSFNNIGAVTYFHFSPSSSNPVQIDLKLGRGGFILGEHDPHAEATTTESDKRSDTKVSDDQPPSERIRARSQSQQTNAKTAPKISQLPPTSDRWALVIGINKYDDLSFNPLYGANDAKKIADDLIAYAGFPSDQVILLNDNQPSDHQPTRERILWWLSSLKENASPSGLMLIAFSGHGIQSQAKSFLMPRDAHVNFDPDYLTENAVNADNITTSLRGSQATQVIVLVDACRNDPYSTKGNEPNKMTKAFVEAFDYDKQNIGKQAYATIFATSPGSEAFQYVNQRMGYFSWALDQVLTGAADDKYYVGGKLTLATLLEYLETKTPQLVRLYNPGRQQVPEAIVGGYLANQLVIENRPRSTNPSPQPPAPIGGRNQAGATVCGNGQYHEPSNSFTWTCRQVGNTVELRRFDGGCSLSLSPSNGGWSGTLQCNNGNNVASYPLTASPNTDWSEIRSSLTWFELKE